MGMIHMYTVNELEDISGFTRRTIGDYIAKGLLAGPSHRGRGARYSQADVDVLRVIPGLRTLMKKEFPNLREVQEFLTHLSAHDVRSLMRKTTEATFVLEVRTLRVRISLAAALPQVSPERLNLALKQLTPEQIGGVDTGRYQLGAVVDMAELLGELEPDAPFTRKESPTNGNLVGNTNGATHLSWSANWLTGSSGNGIDKFAAEDEDIATLESITQRLEKTATDTEMPSVRHESLQFLEVEKEEAAEGGVVVVDRLSEIAERVERLERLMAVK
jgi:DNA-binding transcriptional MerR regulator